MSGELTQFYTDHSHIYSITPFINFTSFNSQKHNTSW